jgi:hypothetical protein
LDDEDEELDDDDDDAAAWRKQLKQASSTPLQWQALVHITPAFTHLQPFVPHRA